MTFVMLDFEADGPIPGDYSMVCFGAIVVEPALERFFFGKLRPISDSPITGFTRSAYTRSRHRQGTCQDFCK